MSEAKDAKLMGPRWESKSQNCAGHLKQKHLWWKKLVTEWVRMILGHLPTSSKFLSQEGIGKIAQSPCLPVAHVSYMLVGIQEIQDLAKAVNMHVIKNWIKVFL